LHNILEINQLHKRYKRIHAVDGLTLSVKPGQVFGLLGPNGSGKTTTLGIVLGVIRSNSGQYTWFGKDHSHAARQKLGAILETPSFYPYLNAVNNLKIIARIKGVGNGRIDDTLKQVGLYDRRFDAFKTYSLGMKQRLAIAAALLSDPEVLILDEPTNGLDPQGIAEIRQLIIEIAKSGKTIILASHLLDEVQKVCSHFAVLQNGKKLYEGSVEELKASDEMVVNAENRDQLKRAAESIDGVISVKETDHHILLKVSETLNAEELNRQLMDAGVALNHLTKKQNSLEQRFLEILSQNQSNN
jgi:ABC-type multidrug transport system ATPase subunit